MRRNNSQFYNQSDASDRIARTKSPNYRTKDTYLGKNNLGEILTKNIHIAQYYIN